MNYIAANTCPAENDSDNVYKKKNLYTLLHSMNGGFLFFPLFFFFIPRHKLIDSLVSPPTFTFHVCDANKENFLAFFFFLRAGN